MTNNISKLATNINARLNALLKKTKKNNTKTNDNRWRKNYNDVEKKYYYSSLSKPLSVWELPPGGIVNNSPTKEYIVGKSGDWNKIEDNNGRSWYYNPKLKEYDWDKPAGLVFTNVNPKEEVRNVKEPEPNNTKGNNVPKNNTKKNNLPKNNLPKNNAKMNNNAAKNNKANTAKNNNDTEYLIGKSGNWEKVENGKGESWYYDTKTSTSQWNAPQGLVFTNVNPRQKIAKNIAEPKNNAK